MQQIREQSADAICRLADEHMETSKILRNPYFERLRSGEMPLDAFRATQEQFYFAVEYFSRPMSAILMRLPSPEQRLGVLSNVVEEHGGFQARAFHEATFRNFLASIGGHPERPSLSIRGPEVHAFNMCLMGACCNEELLTGIACLGIIEHAFAEISARIGQAVVERGWVTKEKLRHYQLHAEIDRQHAADFFALLDTARENPKDRRQVEQGFELGLYLFDRLYRDLQLSPNDVARPI